MQSRYSMNQKNKKPYIKWILISLGIVVVLAGGVSAYWMSLHNWDIEESLEALSPSETDIKTVEPNEDVSSQKGETSMPEEPQTPVEPEKPTEPETPEKTEAPAAEVPSAGKEEKAQEQEKAPPAKEQPVKDATKYQDNLKLPAKPTVINNVLIANKQHPLPQSYAPGESKEARAAFEAMRTEALKAKIDLTAFSTYRDFARQKVLYEGYVAKDGQQAADRYSARPGYSEHQTGLAFDIGETGQEQHWASASFGDTKGGKWLMENAHRYGFILRYPQGAEKITGYMHESWHYRYVGKEVAADIHAKGVTLEEYLDVH